jgi:hypothetical protein
LRWLRWFPWVLWLPWLPNWPPLNADRHCQPCMSSPISQQCLRAGGRTDRETWPALYAFFLCNSFKERITSEIF